MPLHFASLNSGSNGNCYLAGDGTDFVLIDAGISARKTIKRLNQLDIPTEKIRAVFISHEHADHISGLETLSSKYKLPVYITKKTHEQCRLNLLPELLRYFEVNQEISIGALQVLTFSKFHDAAEPSSFVVEHQNKRIGIFTDIGHACENVVRHFKECHAAFLETNYDEEMLNQGSYPYVLKERIKSSTGHLSNKQAFELFHQHRNKNLRYLFFSHISKQNNSVQRIHQLFENFSHETEFITAERDKSSALFTL